MGRKKDLVVKYALNLHHNQQVKREKENSCAVKELGII